jgi:hypothetical protein
MLHRTQVHDPHTVHVNLELDYLVDKGVPTGHDGLIRASSLPGNEAAIIKGGGMSSIRHGMQPLEILVMKKLG